LQSQTGTIAAIKKRLRERTQPLGTSKGKEKERDNQKKREEKKKEKEGGKVGQATCFGRQASWKEGGEDRRRKKMWRAVVKSAGTKTTVSGRKALGKMTHRKMCDFRAKKKKKMGGKTRWPLSNNLLSGGGLSGREKTKERLRLNWEGLETKNKHRGVAW